MSEIEENLEDEIEFEAEESRGVPPWVITFADMVTLLMVFFILLFAIGTIEQEKWRQLKESLREALGADAIEEMGTRQGLDVIRTQVDEQTVHAVDEVGAMVNREMEDIISEVEEFVFKNKLAGEVRVSSDERGSSDYDFRRRVVSGRIGRYDSKGPRYSAPGVRCVEAV